MRGRKRKVTVIEMPLEPVPCPAPPSWLGIYAKQEWKRVAPQMIVRGHLAPDVLATLAAYCVSVGNIRELEDILQETGLVSHTRAHPAFNAQLAAMREARLLAAELGLLPFRRGVDGKQAPTLVASWDDDLLA